MDANELRTLQAPIKARYRDDPAAALVTLRAEGTTGAGLTCSVASGRALAEAGVTLRAVATALGLDAGEAKVWAEGDIDFRGTLGVDKAAPVGFRAIRLFFDVGGDLSDDELATLARLTERYCVVYQTIRSACPIEVSAARA